MSTFFRLAVAALVLCVSAVPAFAQGAFPSKTMRIFVGAPPGGSNDIFARPIVMATPTLPFNHAEYGDPIYELGAEAALRPGRRSDRRDDGRQRAHGHRRSPVGAGEEHEGVHRHRPR